MLLLCHNPRVSVSILSSSHCLYGVPHALRVGYLVSSHFPKPHQGTVWSKLPLGANVCVQWALQQTIIPYIDVQCIPVYSSGPVFPGSTTILTRTKQVLKMKNKRMTCENCCYHATSSEGTGFLFEKQLLYLSQLPSCVGFFFSSKYLSHPMTQFWKISFVTKENPYLETISKRIWLRLNCI